MVKTLAEVKKYTEVDGNDISKCVYWLINERQKADGSFLETSTYKPTKLMVIPTHRQQMFKYACAMYIQCKYECAVCTYNVICMLFLLRYNLSV